MLWFVSRQRYWPDGTTVVEIAQGGRDYANPDMLVEKYDGEGCEYEWLEEAVKAAIYIRSQWRQDSGNESIEIAIGFTGGMTMPFEPDASSDEELLERARNYDLAVREAAALDMEELEAAEEILDGVEEAYRNHNSL